MNLKALFCSLLLSVAACLPASAQEAMGTKFAWGASLTTSADLTGNDLSTIGMDAYFGMQVPGIQLVGLGAGLNVPISESHRTMPVYLLVRSGFKRTHSLCFVDLRAGMSVNDSGSNNRRTGAYGSLGVGFNLASSRKFSSHLILAYSYFQGKEVMEEETLEKIPNLHMATLRLGITF